MLGGLEAPYDFIVLDTGAGISREVITYSLEADETLMVATTEPVSVMDAYAAIKLITQEKPQHAISVILNGVRIPAEADETFAKLNSIVNHFLHRDVEFLGAIPYDKQMVMHAASREPIVRKYPAAAISLSLRAVAHQLIVRHFHSPSEVVPWQGQYFRSDCSDFLSRR